MMLLLDDLPCDSSNTDDDSDDDDVNAVDVVIANASEKFIPTTAFSQNRPTVRKKEKYDFLLQDSLLSLLLDTDDL